MKNLVQLTVVATLAIGVAANSHQHLHRHVKKESGSKVQKRVPDAVIEYVAGPTETVYQLDGKVLDAQKAAAGLKQGEFVVVGETTPTYTPPPPPPPPKPTSSSVQALGAQFIEKPSSPPAPLAPKSTSQPPPPPPKSTQAPKASAAGASSLSSSSSGDSGLDRKFPSGEIKCSVFPSEYGAVAASWLGLKGWVGKQGMKAGFSLKAALSIDSITTGIKGEDCDENSMCSYACPVGYQKTQWSQAQGATGQSIGGLYCNNDGYLELTRASHPYLCERGAGGVSIQNDLDVVVSACRTDYPGTEAMVLPFIAQPGASVEVTNPVQSKYYIWQNKKTTAQYYINKRGYGPEDACVWKSSKDEYGAGDKAPAILGVGEDDNGITYISIFHNDPVSKATLDFNMEITGDVNLKCSYINGVWSGNNGCTTAMRKGGKAVVRYF